VKGPLPSHLWDRLIDAGGLKTARGRLRDADAPLAALLGAAVTIAALRLCGGVDTAIADVIEAINGAGVVIIAEPCGVQHSALPLYTDLREGTEALRLCRTTPAAISLTLSNHAALSSGTEACWLLRGAEGLRVTANTL